jgi:hypothetical protein
MKPAIFATTVIATTAILSGIFSVGSAQAQQRVCIVDNRDNLICGRPATQREIDRYQRNDDSRSNLGRGEIAREINRIYFEVLGRRIDRSGLETYVNRVQDGWSLDRVRSDIAKSQEAKSAINQLYVEVLGRSADSSGLNTYANKLVEGWSLNDIRRDLQRSAEARNRR